MAKTPTKKPTLSKAQIDRVVNRHYQAAKAIGLCTDPANYEEAEDALRALYAAGGLTCPPIHRATSPLHAERITLQTIQECRNAEMARIMTERYKRGEEVFGDAAYIRDTGGLVVDHEDGIGTLYRLAVRGDEDIWAVRGENGSLEPDGTRKIYWLTVHPECRPLLADGTLGPAQEQTARAAVASTYGPTKAQYDLIIRT